MSCSRRAFAFVAFAISFLPSVVTAQSNTPEPQLVRLSYVDGDVRFNVGDSKGPDLKKPWQQATVNLPIESGYALSTGEGRAAVEFESGSMIYVAPNSLVMFTNLWVSGGKLDTEFELVTGTVTLNFWQNPNETLAVHLPTGLMSVEYPESAYDRIDSYLDGFAVTPQADTGSDLVPNGASKMHLDHGETLVFSGDKPVQIQGAGQSQGSSDWDKWVADQVTARNTATEAALKASGMSDTIPGLADLYASGTFSACAPYGACWQPNVAQQAPAQAPNAPATPQGAPATPTPAPFPPTKAPNLIILDGCPTPAWVLTMVTAKTQ